MLTPKKKYFNTLFIPFAKSSSIRKDYKFGKLLGKGGYGSVFYAKNRDTQEERAIKMIKKKDIDDKEQFKKEFQILLDMDHPNIIKLFEVYETDGYIYLVQELCQGGPLFQYIIDKKLLTEEQGAMIMRQIFSAVSFCHQSNICHRDLKPENFLLRNKDDLSSIKLIDFGLATEFKPGESFNSAVGTPYFLAPEMILGKYGVAVDDWALGVILYILISGTPPFNGSSRVDILESILNGNYSFNLLPFKYCSAEAKDLISRLIVKDPVRRLQSHMAYHHPWIQRQVDLESKDVNIDPNIFEKLTVYTKYRDFKKYILYIMARLIPEEEMSLFREIFRKVDTNGNGFICLSEFTQAFQELNNKTQSTVDPKLVENLFFSLDLNGSGSINYTEFLAVFAKNSIYENEKYMVEVFKVLDVNGNGVLAKKEIKAFMMKEMPFFDEAELETILKECDSNGDGVLNYQEMIKMIRGRGLAKVEDLTQLFIVNQ